LGWLAAEEGLPLFGVRFKVGFGNRNLFIESVILKWSKDPSEKERLGRKKVVYDCDIIQETEIEPLTGVRNFVD
tara:strand:+ start:636 stop:857 length:222 start_codon:yes stop_codon:yes gene_type:complete